MKWKLVLTIKKTLLKLCVSGAGPDINVWWFGSSTFQPCVKHAEHYTVGTPVCPLASKFVLN